MNKSSWYVFTLVLIFVAATSFAATSVQEATIASVHLVSETTISLDEDVTMWSYNFEDTDLTDWIFSDPSQVTRVNHWAISDWSPNGGANSWRCFDPTIGDATTGGYGDDWVQLLNLPVQDFTDVVAADLDFQFRCFSEDPTTAWDGGLVMVAYGDDADNLAHVVATPNAGFGDYDYDNMPAFDDWFPGVVTPGWNNVTTYTNGVFDLSAYAGNSYVRISFAFASDGNTNSAGNPEWYGFQVDDIVLTTDETEAFSNDAESGQGDMTFLWGYDAALIDPPTESVPNVFGLFEPTGAPSATHALGIEDYDPNWVVFDHWLECPTVFNAEALAPGETQYFDVSHKGTWTAVANDDQCRFYLQIYTPNTGVWNYATWESGNNYWYGSVPTDWTNASDHWVTPMDMNNVGAQDGIKFRIGWHNGADGYTGDFGGMYWDDLVVMKRSLEHDVQTTIAYISYPTTVGLPVRGLITYTNNGTSEESFVGLWGFNQPTMPVYPGGTTIPLPIQSQTSRYINFTGRTDSSWVPTSAQTGAMMITAGHMVGGDQIPANDKDTTEFVVLVDNFQLGYGARDINAARDVDLGSGAMVHFSPEAEIHNGFFDSATQRLEFQSVNYSWYGDPTDGGPGDMKIHVFAGGDTPGTEIWVSNIITVVDLLPGLNFETHVEDVSGVTELQDLTTDFYVWIETLTASGTNGLPEPLGSDYNSSDRHFTYDGTIATASSIDFGLTIIVDAVDIVNVDPVNGALPTEFALNNAYPNPFNPTTMLTFDVAKLTDVSLKVYNLMGQEIATLVSGAQTIGSHSVTFDASNLSSGVYFVRMQADGFTAMQKIMLMK